MQNTSPSPESAGGPPRLSRLCVKISVLVSMLLEVAEHKRTAVLARSEQPDAQNRKPRVQRKPSESSQERYEYGNIYERTSQSSNDYSHPSPNAINGRYLSTVMSQDHARQHSASSQSSPQTQNHQSSSSLAGSDSTYHPKEHHGCQSSYP